MDQKKIPTHVTNGTSERASSLLGLIWHLTTQLIGTPLQHLTLTISLSPTLKSAKLQIISLQDHFNKRADVGESESD